LPLNGDEPAAWRTARYRADRGCSRGIGRTAFDGRCQSFGAGVMELALKHRGDAFRVIYALQIDTDIWVIHAFQKKSKSGIKTPKQEIDLVQERLRRLKERLQ
jgi:phage-related protein